jgi:hypothetical protein
VIYLQCAIQSALAPVMLFVDLKELVSTTAESIFNTLLSTLIDHGFDNKYLKANLIAFCSDGANTMLGRKSGVAMKQPKHFAKINWPCGIYSIEYCVLILFVNWLLHISFVPIKYIIKLRTYIQFSF